MLQNWALSHCSFFLHSDAITWQTLLPLQMAPAMQSLLVLQLGPVMIWHAPPSLQTWPSEQSESCLHVVLYGRQLSSVVDLSTLNESRTICQ